MHTCENVWIRTWECVEVHMEYMESIQEYMKIYENVW